jgi:hypothetical protein
MFLLRHWNPFEFVLVIAFAKQLINPSFYVQGRKECLQGINERNVMDTLFSRLIKLPRFQVTLDVMFDHPKGKKAAELCKSSLHQNTSHL